MSKKKKSKIDMQDQIDSIMDNFDFGRVAKAMDALEWEWMSAAAGVPDESEIRASARKMLHQAVEEKQGSATGGFETRYRKDDDGAWLELRFCVDEWSTGEM